MKQGEGISEALEDYLEAIYRTILRKNGVRVKDIAERLKVRNPSVTSALKNLEKRGLINYEPYGVISLTKRGLEAAVKLTEKHRLFKGFFMNILGVDQETADETACRMEHVVPKAVYIRLLQFIKYIHTTETCGVDVVAGFQAFRDADEESPGVSPSLDEYFEGTGFDVAEVSYGLGKA